MSLTLSASWTRDTGTSRRYHIDTCLCLRTRACHMKSTDVNIGPCRIHCPCPHRGTLSPAPTPAERPSGPPRPIQSRSFPRGADLTDDQRPFHAPPVPLP